MVSAAAGIRICKEINGDIEFFDEIYGPMFLSVDRALDPIMTKYTVTPITYEGIIRVENYPYPKDAIRKPNGARLDGQILFHTDKSLECITYSDSWEVE